MPLVSPKLALPASPERLAFRAVDSILREDPTLRRVVKAFSSWTGEAADSLPPTLARLPYLATGPLPSSSSWEAEGMHRVDFTIGLRLVVAGTDVDPLLDLWGAVRDALWPAEMARLNAIRAKVAAVGVVKPELKLVSLGHRNADAGMHMLAADGTLRLLLHVPT
ncbi:hypothetical protein [Aquisphaera insulae]|uniref:hypothetical protein n=1 Tax=Aquisphaera insulae TaxID=2712864 RepID=UPI0013EAC248|nr:hypothetical protein [Aquisphaera insulae]